MIILPRRHRVAVRQDSLLENIMKNWSTPICWCGVWHTAGKGQILRVRYTALSDSRHLHITQTLVIIFCRVISKTGCFREIRTQSRNYKLPLSRKVNEFLQQMRPRFCAISCSFAQSSWPSTKLQCRCSNVRLKIFKAMKIHVVAFWVITPCTPHNYMVSIQKTTAHTWFGLRNHFPTCEESYVKVSLARS